MMPPFIGRLYCSSGVFFTRPVARGHHQVMVGLEKSRTARQSAILLAFGEVEQVDDRPAAAFAAQLRQVVDLLPIDLAAVGEEQQIVVRAGDEQVLDRIFVFGLGPLQPLAAAALGAIGARRQSA